MKYIRHTSGAKLAVLMAVDVRRFLDELPVVRRAALDRTERLHQEFQRGEYELEEDGS